MKQGVVQSEVRRPERFLAVRTGRVRTRAPDPGSAEAVGPDSGLRTAEKRVTHTLYSKGGKVLYSFNPPTLVSLFFSSTES